MELIWAYGDMLLLSTSYVMMYQFKRFNHIIETAVGSSKNNAKDLEKLRCFHWELVKVVKVYFLCIDKMD